MATPEATFTAGVHKYLPELADLHREKMANPYRGGTADWWYSGHGHNSRDLWIEWKFLAVPKRPTTVIDLCAPKRAISPLQRVWLRNRLDEGRNVWVIVGTKDGGALFTGGSWELPFTAAAFGSGLLSRKALAAAITHFCRPP